ncbi:hypothetical protein TYRP_014076 [Tyrophagus putrescentiae]|nr:hypothetical protein TYRP_014076 [Tyrophagus putrescentiae]
MKSESNFLIKPTEKSMQKVNTGELKHRFGQEYSKGGRLAPMLCMNPCFSSFWWHSMQMFNFQGSLVLQLLSSVASSIRPTARRMVVGPTGVQLTVLVVMKLFSKRK